MPVVMPTLSPLAPLRRTSPLANAPQRAASPRFNTLSKTGLRIGRETAFNESPARRHSPACTLSPARSTPCTPDRSAAVRRMTLSFCIEAMSSAVPVSNSDSASGVPATRRLGAIASAAISNNAARCDEA